MKQRHFKTYTKQRGVALVLVLLAFFAASVLVVSMVERQRLDIGRIESEFVQVQLHQLARDGESFAKHLLVQAYTDDARRLNSQDRPLFIDRLSEDWAADYVVTLDRGSVAFSLHDLQARMNVNSVFLEDEIDPAAAEILGAALRIADIEFTESHKAAMLAHYKSSGYLQDIGDFAAMLELDDAADVRLLNCFAALPPHAPLNLNTAADAILEAYDLFLGADIRQMILEERSKEAGLETVPSISGERARFGVSSEYFMLKAVAGYRKRELFLQVILHRNPENGSVRTVSRTLNPRPVKEDENPCDTGRREVSI